MHPLSLFGTEAKPSTAQLRWSKPRKRADGVMRLLYGSRCVGLIERLRCGFHWWVGHPRLDLPMARNESPLRTLAAAMDAAGQCCAEALRTSPPPPYVGPGGRRGNEAGAGARLTGEARRRRCARQAGRALWALLRGARVTILTQEAGVLAHSPAESDPDLLEAEAAWAGVVAGELLHAAEPAAEDEPAWEALRTCVERRFRSEFYRAPEEWRTEAAVKQIAAQIRGELEQPTSRVLLQLLAARLEAQEHLLEQGILAALYPYLQRE